MKYFANKPGSNYSEAVFYCLLASIVDGLTVISTYFIASKILSKLNWKFYLLTAVLGAASAIIFENIAFYFQLWSYKKSMPIVPFVDVGVLPFVQLTILVPLTIFLAHKLFGRK